MFQEVKEYAHSGMIDWLTLKIGVESLPEPVIRRLQSMSSRLFKISPDGELQWESYCYESVKSDTHQVCVRIGVDLTIQGSPARLGLPNNAFGSLDIVYCASKMIRFAARHLGLSGLPDCREWRCTRIDVTRNYVMQSEAEARQALNHLKHAPESRQKHSFESFGFYIGKGSSLHQGKIYLKGQDARRNSKRGTAHYSEEQLKKADKLLRAEYTIRRHLFRRLKEDLNIEWHELNPERLIGYHTDFFDPYFSDVEVTDMGNLLETLECVSPTEGQARAAYDCYHRIRMHGYEQAKTTYTKTSWYRHVGLLKAAGLKRADFNPINVTPLRKRPIEVGRPVANWGEIHVA